MIRYDALVGMNPEKIEDISDYISYCKYYFKPKTYEKIKYYFIEDENHQLVDIKEAQIKEDFEFLKRMNKEVLRKKLKRYRSCETVKDFPLNWLKNEILRQNKKFKINNEKQLAVNHISGIFDDPGKLGNYVKKLLPYSFMVYVRFRFEQPYFSRDDDEFCIIQNPVLKEWAFKVPMVRGSSWKGALASAFLDLLEGNHDKLRYIESYFRIFGAGSECVKTLEDSFAHRLNSATDMEKMKSKLIEMLLFELGIRLDKESIDGIKEAHDRDEVVKLIKKIFSQIDKVSPENSVFPCNIKTRKGRAIFYPTYFDYVSLEIINPHNRRRRAGTQPIHFEVVPSGTGGILQIAYIPFDAVLNNEEVVKNEAQKDLNYLLLAIERLSHNGIGAKTKLGWGTFELEEKYCCVNGDLKLEENLGRKGWLIC